MKTVYTHVCMVFFSDIIKIRETENDMSLFSVNYPEFRSDQVILRRPVNEDIPELCMIFDHPLDEAKTRKMLIE